MPTYQYACKDCDHAFDLVQRFSEDSLTVCPECEGRLRKIFNAVGVVFKGSGFYRNDSRAEEKSGAKSGAAKNTSSNDSSGSKSPSSDSSNSDSSTSDSSTSDTKSPAKSESTKSPVKPTADAGVA